MPATPGSREIEVTRRGRSDVVSPDGGFEALPGGSIARVVVTGWLIILLFFGGFGVWALMAPLNGAVVAEGVVKVEGNRKSVQHLDGGIIKQMLVREGDRVLAGALLIVLDDTQARAEHEVLSQQFVVLRTTEERLRAELDQLPALSMPQDLAERANDPFIRSIWNAQVRQFESRLAALQGQRSVISERIAQLEHQITGGEAQVKAYATQLASIQDEANTIRPLVENGLVARPRILQLERSAAGLEGQMADASASIAKSRQAIAEQQQQMAQLDNDRMTDITKDLRDTQAKLVEVIPRLINAQAVLSRMEIRSPYSGRVVALNVFSLGGVIGRGDKILDIVPDHESLIVEAQIGVTEITEVRPQMRAELRLTAYQQRTTPSVHGEVIQVSADRLVEREGKPFYAVQIRVDQNELAQLAGVQLYPGMPATVMIPTVERSAFRYLVGPLATSFERAFRQR